MNFKYSIKKILLYLFTGHNKKLALIDLKNAIYCKINKTKYFPKTILKNNFLQFYLFYKDNIIALIIPIGMKYKRLDDIILYLARHDKSIDDILNSNQYIEIPLFARRQILSISNEWEFDEKFFNFILDMSNNSILVESSYLGKVLKTITNDVLYANYHNIADINGTFKLINRIGEKISKIKEE